MFPVKEKKNSIQLKTNLLY